MKLDLNELNKNRVIEFNYDVEKDEKLDKRIKGIENGKVIGKIYLNYEDDIELKCNFSGFMIIEDSISLEEVPYEFNIDIEETLNEIKENYDNCYDNIKNTLDLKQILWQNIVLEVPISYTKVIDASLKGNGWELLSDEKETTEVDPRLKKLEELLERRD